MPTNALSRRNIIGGLATVPIAAGAVASLAAPALAPAPDPIFAMIDASRAARQRCCELSEQVHSGQSIVSPELLAEYDRAWAEYYAAIPGLMATRPTTMAGLAALVERFEEHAEGCKVDPDTDGLATLLKTIRCFISAEA